MTINLVNVNTSKDRLTKSGEKTDSLIKTIIEYIKSQPQNINTVFTYKAIADKFKNDFDNVNWFGNIKGTNQYREIKDICQVGLNRYPDLVYLLYANVIGQSNDDDKSFNNRIYDKETIDNIRCSLILADIEQNIFRCKIRNTDNTEQCTYTLIFNINENNKIFEKYQPLISMIKSRYENFGATVNIIDTPIEFKLLKIQNRKAKQDTNAQKILSWLANKEKRYIFKISDMLSELNLQKKQFNKIKEKNSSIRTIFKRMTIGQKKGYYKV